MADEESGPYPQVSKELRGNFERGWERGQIKTPMGWEWAAYSQAGLSCGQHTCPE